MASVIPSPIGTWKKILIATKDTIAGGVTWLAYEFIGEINQAPVDEGGAEADTWRKFVIKFEDITSLDAADDQQLAIDVVNMTSGAVDNTWTEGDYQAVAGQLGTFLDNSAGHFVSRLKATRIDAYIRAYAPIPQNYVPGSRIKHFVDSGPPQWSLALNKGFAGGANTAPQACSTITEVTAARRHWGRNYMPTIASSMVDTSGRYSTVPMEAMLGYWVTLYEALMNAEYLPVVPTCVADNQPRHALQGVTALRIDDTLDVIRRRRFENPRQVLELPV